ncbi:MAG: hypothetical protein HGA31_05010 [Candidatus Moranbacteria bacterium]|nr:hypothetical protein [Candidatus Moranbacteria bacterium]
MDTIKAISKRLRELGFNRNETSVYVALTQLGEANATDIAKKADLPRTTAISILKKLESEKYISIQRYKGRSMFWIESPRMLREAFLNRVRQADELGDLLADLYRSEADFPYAKIYDTKAGIKSFIEKIILEADRNGEILTIENPNAGNYHRILSKDYFYTILDMKRGKGIVTRTLITADSAKDIDREKIDRQSIVLREMPEGVDFKASFWIVKDTLVLFSGKYPFVVAVNHRIITESMKSIFEHLWKVSS